MVPIKKLFLVVVSMLLICSSMIAATADQPSGGTDYDTLVLSYDFPAPTLDHVLIDNEEYDRITLGSLPNSCTLYTARLPVLPLKVLLPYGRRVETIKVTVDETISLGSGFHVETGQNVIPLPSNEPRPSRSNQEGPLPDELHTIVGTYLWRGYLILCVNLHPVTYDEASGELLYYDHMNLRVTTQPSLTTPCIRQSQQDSELVGKQVANPQMLQTYEKAPCSAPRELIKYVIITNEDLAGATGTYTFQDLADARTAMGLPAAIITVEDIIANPDYWVNGPWGDNNPSNPFYYGDIQGPLNLFNDTQAKIRNFIRYAYTELNTQYVLLGGDADYSTSDNIVPHRKLFAVEDGLPLGSRELIEEDIPSDVYYANLDGNFNRDEDSHWGENATQNSYNDEDEADLFSEVYVGRACADADDEVSNFVMKTLAYEASTDPYILTGLMVGEYLGFPGVSAYGGNYKDLIIPLFPPEFTVDTLYDRDGTWSKYTLMNILNTQTPALINHLGHGNVQYALKMGTSDIATLTNDKYFFIYSQTCLAGSFDNNYDDCAAEYFTVETPHGAFAVIMNARYGLGSENTLVSPSQVLDESFFTALFTEHLHALGQANHYSKEAHVYHINENGIRWVYYETNLFGDPALKIKPHNAAPDTPETPNGPSSGVTTVEYTFTAVATDPEAEQVYYKFDWGDGTPTDWIGPYNSGMGCSAVHQWTEADTYEVVVKAKDSNGGESGWSEPHAITIVSAPVIQVASIRGGLLRVQAVLKNSGAVDAQHVPWSITLDGGAFIGKETSGILLSIPAGEERTISSKMILGLGPTMVTVHASCDGSEDTLEQNATILLFVIKTTT
ncbi:MAG: hypothetical protein JXA00_01370 [Candidatus Thermoplasmatota archaeon]|nr:hypothetical protein [Candidatus Thermoplasmatota archaeon]